MAAADVGGDLQGSSRGAGWPGRAVPAGLPRTPPPRPPPVALATHHGMTGAACVAALPPPQLRAFIYKLSPSSAELGRARARELRSAGDPVAAATALTKALDLNPDNDLARIDLAELLVELEKLDDAESLLGTVKPNVDWDSRVETLRQGLAFARSGQSGPGEEELAKRVGAQPEGLEARLQLAKRRAGQRN